MRLFLVVAPPVVAAAGVWGYGLAPGLLLGALAAGASWRLWQRSNRRARRRTERDASSEGFRP
jgi:hypothetical protein